MSEMDKFGQFYLSIGSSLLLHTSVGTREGTVARATAFRAETCRARTFVYASHSSSRSLR